MTRSLGHPVTLEQLGDTTQARLPLGKLFWAAADLSCAARANQAQGVVYPYQRRFGRLGIVGAGWELLGLERGTTNGTARTFLISQQLSEREYDNDRRIPLEGWQAVGIAMIRHCSPAQTPERLQVEDVGSVRLDHWLAPAQHQSSGVNREVVASLLQQVGEQGDEPVWVFSRVQDTGRFDAMRQAGMQPVEKYRQYPELMEGSDARVQIWVKEPVA